MSAALDTRTSRLLIYSTLIQGLIFEQTSITIWFLKQMVKPQPSIITIETNKGLTL